MPSKKKKDAVWECGRDKCPKPDGLNFKFMKEFWDVIKPEVLRFLDEFYVNGRFSKETNASFLALIPKVQDPQNLNQYRPISLIDYIYKIVAKLLTRRLKRCCQMLLMSDKLPLLKADTCYIV